MSETLAEDWKRVALDDVVFNTHDDGHVIAFKSGRGYLLGALVRWREGGLMKRMMPMTILNQNSIAVFIKEKKFKTGAEMLKK